MADSGGPPEPVMEVPPPKEIKILETAEDIHNRRTEVSLFSHSDFEMKTHFDQYE